MVLFGGFLGAGLFVGVPWGLGGALIVNEASMPLLKYGDITLTSHEWRVIMVGVLLPHWNKTSFPLQSYHKNQHK